MKKLILAISMVSLSTFAQTSAQRRTVVVRDPQTQKATKTTVVTTAPVYTSSSSSIRWGLGFATWGATQPVSGGPAISIMMEFNEMTSLVAFF
jgi:hypothetical protein